MRIFLCGAQGTGKSTLVTSLPDSFGLEKKDSFSREFLKKDPSIQTRASENYNEFQDKILLHCLTQYVNDDNFISSRSVIDSFAYIKANESENEVMLRNILNHYVDYVTTENDIYIYLPIEFELSDGNNSNRDLDIEYQKRVDESMRDYFERFKRMNRRANYYILTGDVETRLEKLKEIINENRKDV